jgi:hypothetical protein
MYPPRFRCVAPGHQFAADVCGFKIDQNVMVQDIARVIARNQIHDIDEALNRDSQPRFFANLT